MPRFMIRAVFAKNLGVAWAYLLGSSEESTAIASETLTESFGSPVCILLKVGGVSRAASDG